MTPLDLAYYQRNALACILAQAINAMDEPRRAGVGHDPSQPPEWQTTVILELPTGQVSFHIHERERHLFERLPKYPGHWDGHTDSEKWLRLLAHLNIKDPARFVPG